MAVIRKIEKTEKKKGQTRLTFDNGISCSLYYGELSAMKEAGIPLLPDTELTDGQFSWLIRDLVGKRAKKRALFLLEQRDCSEQQLREKLSRGEYPALCIDEAVAYVKKFHYLDDKRFACHYIRYSKEKYSRRQLEIKLKQKGISSRDVSFALEEEYPVRDSDSIETEQIKKLLQKRKYDSQGADEKEKQRTYAYLMRRGFSSGKVLQMMEQHG